MEVLDTPFPDPHSAVPTLQPPISAAVAVSRTERDEPDVFEGIMTALTEQEAVIQIAADDGVYNALQNAQECCVSYKDHMALPDPMSGTIISFQPNSEVDSGFYTIHIVFVNPSFHDTKQIRRYLLQNRPPSGSDEDELPSEQDIETIRDLSANLEGTGELRPTPISRGPAKVSMPVNFAVTFPEKSHLSLVREARVVTMNARGAMLEIDLDTSEYRALLQSTRRCCLQFRDQPRLPESVPGKTVMIEPIVDKGVRRYRIGLVYQNLPGHSERKLTEFMSNWVDRQIERDVPLKPPSISGPPKKSTDKGTFRQTRRRPRLTFPMPVKLTLIRREADAGPLVFGGIIQDLSEYGTMVLADIDEPTHELLRRQHLEGSISFGRNFPELPESSAIKVMWVRHEPDESGKQKHLLGLSFVRVSREVTETIRQFVLLHLGDSAPVLTARENELTADSYDDDILPSSPLTNEEMEFEVIEIADSPSDSASGNMSTEPLLPGGSTLSSYAVSSSASDETVGYAIGPEDAETAYSNKVALRRGPTQEEDETSQFGERLKTVKRALVVIGILLVANLIATTYLLIRLEAMTDRGEDVPATGTQYQ